MQQQFTDEYIKEKTKVYTLEALQNETLVTTEFEAMNEGLHPVSGRDLDTVDSFIQDMMSIWTLDLNVSYEREAEIESIVTQVVHNNLPQDLLNE